MTRVSRGPVRASDVCLDGYRQFTRYYAGMTVIA